MAHSELSAAERAAKRRRRIVSLLSLAVMAAVFVLVALYVGKPLLAFIGEPERFRTWVDAHGLWGQLALVGIMCLQVVISVIPGEVVEIGAGYAFGAGEGMALCLTGAALGTILIYGFTKLWGIRMVEAFVSREKIRSLGFIRDARRLNLLVFILFLIPGTPKDIITYFIGLTPMRLGVFLGLSTIARIPSVISSTLGGAALGLQNYGLAALVFVLTAAISGAGLLVYRRLSRKGEAAR